MAERRRETTTKPGGERRVRVSHRRGGL